MTPGAAPLSDAQRDELAEVLARQAIYERSPGGVLRARMLTLMFRSFEQGGLSPAEREEPAELKRRYPPLPPHPMMIEQIAVLEDLCRRIKAGERDAAVP
jgi:hypothetical protein